MNRKADEQVKFSKEEINKKLKTREKMDHMHWVRKIELSLAKDVLD